MICTTDATEAEAVVGELAVEDDEDDEGTTTFLCARSIRRPDTDNGEGTFGTGGGGGGSGICRR